MDQPEIAQFIVDRSGAPQAANAPTPQLFYPSPPPAAIYVAQPRVAPYGSGPVVAALLVVLLAVTVFYLARQSRKERSLSRDLAACGWVLYTRPGCSFCAKQTAALGVKTYPKQVVCARATPLETVAGFQPPYACKDVKAFPFWANEFTGATRTGFQGREQLRQMLRNPSAS